MFGMRAARHVKSTWLLAAAITATVALSGCTAIAESSSDSPSDTVGRVGELPLPASAGSRTGATSESANSALGDADSTDASDSSTPPSTSIDASSTTTSVPSFIPVGAHTTGNRVLMIGDSVTASVSKRYGGQACDALVPLGWKLEIDAEVGRFIDFGKLVLDKRLDAGWDAVVIFLGNNYGEKQGVFESYLREMLQRIAPRPTILINTSLFDPVQQQVNDAIAYDAAAFPNVSVIDWAKVTADDPTLTGADNLHLTEAGRRALAYQLAVAMGQAPVTPGDCLDTNFHNDSAGSPNGPPGNSTKPKTTSTTTKPTSSATKPTSSTTKPTTSTQNTTSGTTGNTTATTASQSTTATSAAPASTTATTQAPPTTAAITIPTVPPPTASTAAGSPTQ